jgi:hypothetical protein
MSLSGGSMSGWPLCGAVLLIIPTTFVVGALMGHPPTWLVSQNPVVLLGSLGVAALGNLSSLVHAKVLKGQPATLRIDITASVASIVVLSISVLLGTLLLDMRL